MNDTQRWAFREEETKPEGRHPAEWVWGYEAEEEPVTERYIRENGIQTAVER